MPGIDAQHYNTIQEHLFFLIALSTLLSSAVRLTLTLSGRNILLGRRSNTTNEQSAAQCPTEHTTSCLSIIISHTCHKQSDLARTSDAMVMVLQCGWPQESNLLISNQVFGFTRALFFLSICTMENVQHLSEL